MDIGVAGVSSVERIGQGGFGIVYRAHQDAFDRTVAVKVMTDVDVDDAMRERFTREVRAIGRLSGHPHIVSVYEHGTTSAGSPYLLMEYCERGSYGDALRNGTLQSWDRAVDVGIGIAGALEVTHQNGLLHRDVKPDNILIDRFGTPKLADFGIAKNPAQAGLTVAGSLIGSPHYLAPEVILGQDPSPASDLYALAASIYALITGDPPFMRSTDTSIAPLLHRITSEHAPTLHHRGVPGPVADVLARGMARHPGHRPPSCAAFADELQRARQLADSANATMAGPPPRFGGGPPGPSYPPPGPGTPPSVQHSGPRPVVAAAGPIAAPAGQVGAPAARRRRLAPALIGVGSAVVLLGTVGVLVAVFTGGGDAAAPGPTSSAPTTPTGNALSNPQAANALRITAAQATDLGGPEWTAAAGGGNDINANAAFCGQQLAAGPSNFSQLAFVPATAAAPPTLSTAGAVFESADAAETYQRRRNASVSCGTWTVGADSLAVFEPPISPRLVGCQCQDVAVHEILITAADGSEFSQYSLLAQQDRYISAAFYLTAGAADDQELAFLGNLMDALVERVNDVATGGES